MTGNVDMDKEGCFTPWGRGFVTPTDVLVAARHPGVRTVIVPHTEEERFTEVQRRMKDSGVKGVEHVTFVGAKTIWHAIGMAFHKDVATAETLQLNAKDKGSKMASLGEQSRPLNTLQESDCTRGTCAALDALPCTWERVVLVVVC